MEPLGKQIYLRRLPVIWIKLNVSNGYIFELKCWCPSGPVIRELFVRMLLVESTIQFQVFTLSCVQRLIAQYGSHYR